MTATFIPLMAAKASADAAGYRHPPRTVARSRNSAIQGNIAAGRTIARKSPAVTM